MKPFTSLTVKLLLPLFIGSVTIFLISTYMIGRSSKTLLEQEMKTLAYEYLDMFILATETNANKANIIRVTNALGSYSDINEILIIDNETQTVLTSNKNKMVGEKFDKLPKHYQSKVSPETLHINEHNFTPLSEGQYLLIKNVKLLSEDKSYIKPMTVMILLKPEGIQTILNNYFRNLFIQTTGLFLLLFLFLYFTIRTIILLPIKRMLKSMDEGLYSNEPILCDESLNNELGVLARAYNTLLLCNFEQQNALLGVNRNLTQLSEIDALTQIPNRRQFDLKIETEWNRAKRNETQLSLMMIDIDFFKNFNDTYGHQVGDACLIEVARALKQTAQRPGDLLCRYGGEEFCILISESEGDVELFAEQCRQAVAALSVKIEHLDNPETTKNKIPVTISIGLATCKPGEFSRIEKLIQQADQALYEAKAQGRNCVSVAPFFIPPCSQRPEPNRPSDFR